MSVPSHQLSPRPDGLRRVPSAPIRLSRPTPAGTPFESFYRREFPRLAGSLYMACGDRAIAEEVSQEAFARALNHWPRVAQMDSPAGWLYRVAFNLLRREWKRNKRADEYRQANQNGVVAIVRDELAERADLVQALRQLPLEQATAVVLRHVLDYSTDDAAKILKVSPGALRMSLMRAMKSLRNFDALNLQDEVDDES